MRRQIAHATAAVCLAYCLLPAAAWAQSAITGVVADSSEGVLPGVTVEAVSPALIEKMRSAVTDAEGRYTILNLRPGTYTVTFTLAGFAPFVRDAMTLPSDFTATVNAELRVGALEETVTVSGEAPVVDVQSTERGRPTWPLCASPPISRRARPAQLVQCGAEIRRGVRPDR